MIANHAKLTKRYRISGHLVLKTALHLGGGGVPARGTDSPILRDGYERPYIPGSSLKGALRAAVERIAPSLEDTTACGLFAPAHVLLQQAEGQQVGPDECLTPLHEKHPKKKAYRELEEGLGEKIKRHMDKLKLLLDGTFEEPKPKDQKKQVVAEDHLMLALDHNLCDVCKAFGSPFMASRVYFHDAPVNEDGWMGLTQVRDGVGIDRDSGRAVDRIKYDYEIVPPDTFFDFSLTVESSDAKTLGLVALALHELQQGNVPLGGIRSRGLGRCALENATVEYIDFADLTAYLLEGEWQETSLDQFIKDHIAILLTKEA